MRAAVMDLGTNSFKLLVAEGDGGDVNVLLDRQEVVRLGDGLALSGGFLRDAMDRAVLEVGKMLELCEALDAQALLAVGTMGFRKASNGEELLKAIKDRYSLEVRIISGQEEAELSFEASALKGPRLVLDIGGGSTEMVFGDRSIQGAVSVEAGALFLTDLFLDPRTVPSREALEAAHRRGREALETGLKELGILGSGVPLCGVGGTFTTLASVALGLERYDPHRVHGLFISLKELELQHVMYASMTGEERRSIPGMHPKRADIAIGGAVIALEAVRLFEATGVTVSARGLRHALMERLLRGEV
ncbi:MAG: hypothetical protein N2315_08410 [Thermanaerothrix sp.]|nr:hypothetical protein [Thermanaerothrix sp.]